MTHRRLTFAIFLALSACTQAPNPASDATPMETEPVAAPEKVMTPAAREPIGPDPALPVEPMEPMDVKPCGAQELCFDALPQVVMDTTEGGARQWDRYACAPETDESGPERVYRVVVPRAGFLSARVSGEPADVDIDLHILTERDPEACLDRGHKTAGAWLEPGEYWLVADSWTDEDDRVLSGAYTLTVNLTVPEALERHGVRKEIASEGLRALSRAWERGETRRLEYALIDFSIHSRERRLWVVDLGTGELLYHIHTAHGERSVVGEDLGVASVFSNIPGSHQSSLGLMRAAETYVGDFGYSMRLDGLEEGFNDKVRARDIVAHPWNGNIGSIIEERGWVVPSWGCATLEPGIAAEVIDTLSDGALLFFWYPDPVWREGSVYLR